MKKVIVIGAGILGATTAYELARSGVEVMLVDRFDTGQATDAAAGIVCPWLSQRRNKAWYKLAKGGARLYPDLIAKLDADGEKETGYAQIGALSIHTDEKKLDALQKRILKRRKDAPEIGNITLLNTEETKRTFPALEENYQSIHVSGAARVDGRALRNSLIRAAQKHGTKLIVGDAHLLHVGNQITGISIANKSFEADIVIATGGAWMNELLKPIGVDFAVITQKAQIIHLELTGIDTSTWPVILPPNDQFILAFNNGRIVIGATHENNIGFDQRVTAGGIHEILAKALHVAPGLANSTVLETRVGFRPFTPGSLPIIGAMPNFEGLLLANGLGASGLTTGPFIGTQLARLALGKELEIDLADYNVANAIS